MSFELIGIVTIVGPEGSCKTSMGLSFPKPLHHLDLDVGGFNRAAWRFDQKGITSFSFPKPLTAADIAKMRGLPSPDPSIRTVGIPKKIEGSKELWQTIIDRIVASCLDSAVKSIQIDSATMMYSIGCAAYLQELQEKQLIKWKSDPQTRTRQFDENDYREKLQPIEYGNVYERLDRVFHTARSYKKNLILIHYPTDEYGKVSDGRGGLEDGKTGKLIIDGYKNTTRESDLVVWTSVKEIIEKGGKKVNKPIARITKCGIRGMGLDVVGMEIPATFEGIANLRALIVGEDTADA